MADLPFPYQFVVSNLLSVSQRLDVLQVSLWSWTRYDGFPARVLPLLNGQIVLGQLTLRDYDTNNLVAQVPVTVNGPEGLYAGSSFSLGIEAGFVGASGPLVAPGQCLSVKIQFDADLNVELGSQALTPDAALTTKVSDNLPQPDAWRIEDDLDSGLLTYGIGVALYSSAQAAPRSVRLRPELLDGYSAAGFGSVPHKTPAGLSWSQPASLVATVDTAALITAFNGSVQYE